MIDVFSRSWEITKLTFSVIKKDKELLAYPLLACFFSLLFIILMMFPVLLSFMTAEIGLFGGLELVVVFLAYLGLSVIATFFNVAVVYTAKTRFEGGNATFSESLRFTFSKIKLIFLWGLMSATVGLLLHLLDRMSRNSGSVGRIIMSIVISTLGMVWGIITLFVIPSMVYHNLTPIDAIKKSVQVLKKTWGESLIRYYGLGMVQSVLLILGVGIAVLLYLALSPIGTPGILISVIFGVLYVILIMVVFGLANTVFNTALYSYASTGKVPTGYSRDILSSAFKVDNTSR